MDLTWFNPFDLTKQYAQQNMWGKLLKFPAHPPYKPIRSTHEQRSETGASKRTKISCGSRSGVVRGRQGSSGVVRSRQESSGVVRGRQGSSGVVRGRQGSSGVVRGRQESSGVVRGRQGSSGVVRSRQESSGVVRGRQGSSGVVRGRQGSSGVVSDRGRQSRQESSGVVRSRQLKLDNCCCHLCSRISHVTKSSATGLCPHSFNHLSLSLFLSLTQAFQREARFHPSSERSRSWASVTQPAHHPARGTWCDHSDTASLSQTPEIWLYRRRVQILLGIRRLMQEAQREAPTSHQ